jgi:thiol-disulfide isomerase/thioredoxin
MSSPRGRRGYLAAAGALVAVSAIAVAFAGHTNATRLAGGPADPNNLPVGATAPALDAKGWLNSAPLTPADLSGKVVVYDFWTYSCVNCVRTVPYLRSWVDRYSADGLVVVGIHSPEFDFEHNHANVANAVKRLGVTWPVALDDDMTIWNAFNNQYWPADYVADRTGHVRFTHFGEGEYAGTEDVLRSLLSVAPTSPRAAPPGSTTVPPAGAGATITAETYLGTGHGAAGAQPGPAQYPEPGTLQSGDARLVGRWTGETDDVQAGAAGSAIVLDYHAREVNLVMATAAPGKAPVDVLVTLDGRPLPPAYRTAQTMVDAQGRTFVHVDFSDLYRLVLGPAVEDHVVRLFAEGPGLQGFAFTFGG